MYASVRVRACIQIHCVYLSIYLAKWPRLCVIVVFIVKHRGVRVFVAEILPYMCPCSAGLLVALCKLKS